MQNVEKQAKNRNSVAFLTLGCKVNHYETERMQRQFKEAGYKIAEFTDLADVYIINTCTVTNMADRKSRKMIHRARRRNPDGLVAVVGCYAQTARERLESDGDVDMVVGNDGKEKIVDIVKERLCDVGVMDETALRQEGERRRERTRAYVKIQDGCNQFCSYCIIPYVRGRLTSKPMNRTLDEIKGLVDEGYKEVVLSGIHLSSYGVDLTSHKDFATLEGEPLLNLMEEISRIDGLERIRLSSLEPRLIKEKFVKQLTTIHKACPHFHLSLQSGCDATLKRMNRKYTTEEYGEACACIRSHYQNPAITTDVIVGFPGETTEEFQDTLRFVRKMAFAGMHVFKYSIRSGTKAEGMPDQVPEQVKNERSNEMARLEEALRHAYMESFLGKRQRILVEEERTMGDRRYYLGHNERYVKLAVNVERFGECPVNEMVWATPSRFLDADTLLGLNS